MNKKTISLTTAAVLMLSALTLLPSDASAWQAFVCSNGSLERGIRANFSWRLIGCPMPDIRKQQINDAAADWNELAGMKDRFAVFTDGAQCGPTTNILEGNFEIAFVPDSSPLWQESDYQGQTALVYEFCGDGAHGVVGSQILIHSEQLSSDLETELNADMAGRREVLIHEFGHALGMEHVFDMSVMYESPPFARAGRRDGTPTSPVRSSAARWATDSDFALVDAFHGSGAEGRPDVAVSPWVLRSSIQKHHASTPQLRCPGQTFDVSYTTANFGKKQTGTVPVWIVLSTNDNISTSDLIVHMTTTGRGRGESGTHAKTITVPGGVTPGATYNVGVIVDPLNVVGEDDENNNAAESGRFLRIGSGC